ncbi:hypothetical protein MTO96_031524 [Rhipicephalus appendiculatus]
MGTALTYEDARRKERQAEYRSDLNTDATDEDCEQRGTPSSHAASPVCSAVPNITQPLDPGNAMPRKRSRLVVSSDSQPVDPGNSVPRKRSRVIVSSDSESNCSANDSHEQCSPESDQGAVLPFVSCPPPRSSASSNDAFSASFSTLDPPPEATLQQNLGGLKALLNGILTKLVTVEDKIDAQAMALKRVETSLMANNEDVPSTKEEMLTLLPLSTDVAVSSLEDLLTDRENKKALASGLALF